MSLLYNPEHTRNLVLYFQVHQPRRLRGVKFFDIGSGLPYFDDASNKEIIQRIATECYLPANKVLLKLIRKNPSVKVAFSISGVTLEQFEEHAPEVLESFRALAATGNVEFLCETYYHSLACMIYGHEFEIQILKHAEAIERHFGARPTVFRNTELIYNDDIGRRVCMLGFNGMFTDGVPKALCNHNPHHVFKHPVEADLKVLFRDGLLSDDIAFRFIQYGKSLTAEQYLQWIDMVPPQENLINLAMDYETFGEHHKKETGILGFLEKFLSAVASKPSYRMLKPSEAITVLTPQSEISIPQYISWADKERDLSAWLGNDMQRDAFDTLLKLERDIKNLDDSNLLKTWRYLQGSDHLYYISTKKGTDGSVHNYFSPYASPYEAFMNFMNVLTDLSLQVSAKKQARKKVSARPKKSSVKATLLDQPATELILHSEDSR